MKILIIDRDQLASQMISSRLASELDCQVIEEPVKNDAMERLANESFDVVIVDPSPMKDAKAMVMNIRRASRTYPYIIIMGEDIDSESIKNMGANNLLVKPINPQLVKESIQDAKFLKSYINQLGDISEDFPSAGGVISKSAFNQLFLSAIERGWRYCENAHVLSVSIENYQEIKELDGNQHAAYGISKLAYHLVRLRRQSDVIGQVAVNQYSLLLQRPANFNEAMDAAKRFAATLDEINDFVPAEGNTLKIRVVLMTLPTGHYSFDQTILKKP